MNMGRPAWIRHGLDRSKEILTRAASEKPTEALEVRVTFITVVTAAVQIRAVMIDLPNLNDRIPNWRTGRIEDTTAEIGHFTHRCVDRVVDDQ